MHTQPVYCHVCRYHRAPSVTRVCWWCRQSAQLASVLAVHDAAGLLPLPATDFMEPPRSASQVLFAEKLT